MSDATKSSISNYYDLEDSSHYLPQIRAACEL